MNSTIGWLALLGAVLLVLWLAVMNGAAQATCEQTMSPDVCWVSLNP